MLMLMPQAETPGVTHFGAYHRPPDVHFVYPKKTIYADSSCTYTDRTDTENTDSGTENTDHTMVTIVTVVLI